MKIALISVEDKKSNVIINGLRNFLTERNHSVKVIVEAELSPIEKMDCIFAVAPTRSVMVAESYIFMLLNNKTDITSYSADFYFAAEEISINAPCVLSCDPAKIVDYIENVYNNFLQKGDYPSRNFTNPGEAITWQKVKYLRFESMALVYLHYVSRKLTINFDMEELLEYVENTYDIHSWDSPGLGGFARDFMTLLYKQILDKTNLNTCTDVDQAYYFRALYEMGNDDELLAIAQPDIKCIGVWQYFAGKAYQHKAVQHQTSSNHLFELATKNLTDYLKDKDSYDEYELDKVAYEVLVEKSESVEQSIKKDLVTNDDETENRIENQKQQVDYQTLYRFFAEHSLLPGKTVFLAPYSQKIYTVPFWFWMFLAEVLEEQGFIVATICNFDNPPIEGTKPVFIPQKKLIPILEVAGCFIGVRGKLHDQAEAASCLKIGVYNGGAFYRTIPHNANLQEILPLQDYNFNSFCEFEYTLRTEQSLIKTLTDLVVNYIGGAQGMKQNDIISKTKSALKNLGRQKKKQKRVGIMTWFFFHNYGAMLQAYATHYAIDAMCPDANAELINFIPEGRSRRSGVGTHILYENPPKEYVEARDMHIDTLNKRMELFEAFKHEHMKLSDAFSNINHLSAGCDYDVYLSGSDQIWNTSLVKSYDAVFPYMLGFTNNPNKLAYGCGMAPRNHEPFEVDFKYVKLLKPYKNFMVRENVAADTLRRYFDTPVDVILDPTLLLEADEYKILVRKPDYDIENSYIFTYILGRMNGNLDGELTEILTEFAKKHGRRMYLAYNGIPINNEFITTLTAIGPCEWLWLIQNTDLIVTTSFHATAFSIIYNRPFICIFPDQRKTTLLEKVGFGDQTIDKFRQMLTLNVNYSLDYTNANKLLAEERNRCRALLKEAIDNCEC